MVCAKRVQHPKLPGSLSKSFIGVEVLKLCCSIARPAAPANKKVVSKEVLTPSPIASMQQTPKVSTRAPTNAALRTRDRPAIVQLVTSRVWKSRGHQPPELKLEWFT